MEAEEDGGGVDEEDDGEISQAAEAVGAEVEEAEIERRTGVEGGEGTEHAAGIGDADADQVIKRTVGKRGGVGVLEEGAGSGGGEDDIAEIAQGIGEDPAGDELVAFERGGVRRRRGGWRG